MMTSLRHRHVRAAAASTATTAMTSAATTVAGRARARVNDSADSRRAFTVRATDVALAAALLTVRFRVGFLSFAVGASMEPTLQGFGIYQLDRVPRRQRAHVARGEIVAAFTRHGPLLKRVVGLPGERVRVDRCGRVEIDGHQLDERTVRLDAHGNSTPANIVVPDGHVFLLGDNRPHSYDSRDFGPVKARTLKGRFVCSLWPRVVDDGQPSRAAAKR